MDTALLVDRGIHRKQALYKLLFAHLQAEDCNRAFVLDGAIVS